MRWQAKEQDQQFEVLCSYCEVYNEVIYDLLVSSSGPLDLRCPPRAEDLAAPLKGCWHVGIMQAAVWVRCLHPALELVLDCLAPG